MAFPNEKCLVKTLVPLSSLPACVLLKVTPSASAKSKGLNTLCKLKLQPLFYMVPTPINPPCPSQGFPHLEMNPINNINACLQLKDRGHFLCHLLDPRGYSETPRTGKLCSFSRVSLGSAMRNFAVLQCSSLYSHHVSRITGNFLGETPGCSPQCSPGDIPRGMVNNSGMCLKSSAPVEHQGAESREQTLQDPQELGQIWTGRTWATMLNSCLAQLNTHRAPTHTDKLSRSCIKNDRRRENKKSQQKSIRLSSLSKHQGTDNGKAGT